LAREERCWPKAERERRVPVVVPIVQTDRRQYFPANASHAISAGFERCLRSGNGRMRFERPRNDVTHRQLRLSRDHERQQRDHSLSPVNTVTSADKPARTVKSAGRSTHSIRTGTRCTTLIKLPVALSGGNSAKLAPVPPETLATVPLSFFPGNAS